MLRSRKVLSGCCSFDTHEACPKRWIEDTDKTVPAYPCACSCACHETLTEEKKREVGRILLDALQSQES